MKLLIKNGLLINADQSLNADILCEGNKIIQIESDISIEVDKIIDASDCYVFPGGIDPHVHMHLPSPAGYSADDFLSGSKAALFGATTTIIDFVTPKKGQSLIEALEERKKEAANSVIDYSFHVSPIEWTDTTEEEIRQCIQEEGITSFKIYMAYKNSIGLDDEDIKKVMRAVSKYGGIVLAHCELGDDIEVLRNNFAKQGNLSPEFHPRSRPAKLEAIAVKKFIDMGKETDCPIYIVHVSAKGSLHYIQKGQQNGQKVYAETCPQYLLLDDSKYEGSFGQTAPFVMSPPLRTKFDNEALWQAISDETVQTIGTDHCPFTLEQKEHGKDDFRKIPNGAGGVEHRMALLHTYGVLTNKITLNQYVNLTSTQAAKIFGLYPQKGVLQVGSDADILIWNPKAESIISAKTHHQNCDTNIFEDVKTRGNIEHVVLQGKLVKIDEKNMTKHRKGSFLARLLTSNF